MVEQGQDAPRGVPPRFPAGWNMISPLPTIYVFSFGYKFSGPPQDASGNGGGFVFDCRALPNPFWDPAVRAYSGLEAPVLAWLGREAEVQAYAGHAAELVLLSARTYRRLGRGRLMAAFGCTGGRHRSPYLARELAGRLQAEGFAVQLTHLDVEKEQARFAHERDGAGGGAGHPSQAPH